MENHKKYLCAARDAFLLASLAVICVLGLLLFVEGGPLAVAMMAGAGTGVAPALPVQLMLAFDTVLPISYGAGFILFAFGMSRGERGSQLLAATALFITIGVGLDFVENALAVSAWESGNQELPLVTVAKYGMLGIGAFLISVLMEPRSAVGRMAVPIFRYVTPVSLALLLSGIGGASAVWVFVPNLLGTFLFLAFIAHAESKAL